MLKSKVEQLRREGYSFSEIAKKVNKSKNFVWKLSKDISFNCKGKRRYHQQVKGVIVNIKPQKSELTHKKIRIIGHVLFDGSLFKINYHYIVRYINSSEELINQFIKDVKRVYGLKPTSLEIIKKKNITNYKVSFKYKLLFEDLKKYFNSYSTKTVSPIPREIMNSKRNIKLEFLRTFWEDEGSITSDGRLMADQKNEIIIKQLIKLHEEFGLYFKICKYACYTGLMYKIYLPKTKENLVKFDKLSLFNKSIVTHGKNLGKKKREVLKKIIKIN